MVEVKEMQREVCYKAHRYKVFSGVRIVVITLTKLIPSPILIAGHRGLVSYEGQFTICCGCGETVHFNQVCPKRRRVGFETTKEPIVPWADNAVSGNRSLRSDREENERGGGPTENTDGLRRRTSSRRRGTNARGQHAFDWCSVGTERRIGTRWDRRKWRPE